MTVRGERRPRGRGEFGNPDTVERGDCEAKDSTSSRERVCQPFCTLIMAYFSLVRSCCESWSLLVSGPPMVALTSPTSEILPFDTLLVVRVCPKSLDRLTTSASPLTLDLLTSPLAVRFAPERLLGGGLCDCVFERCSCTASVTVLFAVDPFCSCNSTDLIFCDPSWLDEVEVGGVSSSSSSSSGTVGRAAVLETSLVDTFKGICCEAFESSELRARFVIVDSGGASVNGCGSSMVDACVTACCMLVSWSAASAMSGGRFKPGSGGNGRVTVYVYDP